jgi:hypothetical protein
MFWGSAVFESKYGVAKHCSIWKRVSPALPFRDVFPDIGVALATTA